MNIKRTLMAQTLERLMKANHMTVADLSRTLGVSYTTINDWVHGVTFPRDDKIEMIAKRFNLEEDALRLGKYKPIGEPDKNSYANLIVAYEQADERIRKAVDALLGI